MESHDLLEEYLEEGVLWFLLTELFLGLRVLFLERPLEKLSPFIPSWTILLGLEPRFILYYISMRL